jgi:hypothetical protein
MPKPKAPPKVSPSRSGAKPAAPHPGSVQAELAGETVLSAGHHRILARSARFLVTIQSPRLLPRARREGYTAAEHAEGWRLWQTASGSNRPFEHWLAEKAAAVGGPDVDRMQKLSAIDEFENKWFPRARAIIQRVVPGSRRTEFTEAFFRDLDQQPLGPAVVGSVHTFLLRVEDLSASPQPDAQAVREKLSERGLTDLAIEEMRAVLRGVESQAKRTAPPVEVNGAALKAAQEAQMKALDELESWLNDWATSLRDVFGTKEQMNLGIVQDERGEEREGG